MTPATEMMLQSITSFIFPTPCRHPLLINFRVWERVITPMKRQERAPVETKASSVLKKLKKSLPPPMMSIARTAALIMPIFIIAFR